MNNEKVIPELQVGIFSAEEISFTLNGLYKPESDNLRLSGNCKVFYKSGGIVLKSGDREFESPGQLVLIPVNNGSSSFTLHDVSHRDQFSLAAKRGPDFHRLPEVCCHGGKDHCGKPDLN